MVYPTNDTPNPMIHQIIDTPNFCLDLGVLCACSGPESIVSFPWRQKGDGRQGRDANALLLTLTRYHDIGEIRVMGISYSI